MEGFSHLDRRGRAKMVDVGGKEPTFREAVATGRIIVGAKVMALLREQKLPKGDALAVARIAGIMGAKKTGELIPLCHPLPLTKCEVEIFLREEEEAAEVRCTAAAHAPTGVEMEALTGVQVALLALYDMCKGISKNMVIENVHLVSKKGGKSGDFLWEK